MAMRTFIVHLEADVKMQLDDAVIDVVDDDWRRGLYDLHTPEQIAAHVAFNTIGHGRKLSWLDGWADQQDVNESHEEPDWDVSATEL